MPISEQACSPLKAMTREAVTNPKNQALRPSCTIASTLKIHAPHSKSWQLGQPPTLFACPTPTSSGIGQSRRTGWSCRSWATKGTDRKRSVELWDQFSSHWSPAGPGHHHSLQSVSLRRRCRVIGQIRTDPDSILHFCYRNKAANT